MSNKLKMRGFEIIPTITNTKNFKMPVRSTEKSSGYDIFYNGEKTITINPGSCSVVISLGINAYMAKNEFLMIVPRSSLGFKQNLMLVNTVGIIDSDYYMNPDNYGEIKLKLFNYGDTPSFINPGDKVVQGIFQEYLLIDNDNVNNKRVGGIGSTGE